MKTENILKTIQAIFLNNFELFYNPDFLFLYIHEIFFEKSMKRIQVIF